MPLGRRATRRQITAGSHEQPVPPAVTVAIRIFRRSAAPPRQSETLTWARVHGSASALNELGRAYLVPGDAAIVERLLRSGRHAKAMTRAAPLWKGRAFHFPR